MYIMLQVTRDLFTSGLSVDQTDFDKDFKTGINDLSLIVSEAHCAIKAVYNNPRCIVETTQSDVIVNRARARGAMDIFKEVRALYKNCDRPSVEQNISSFIYHFEPMSHEIERLSNEILNWLI